MSYILNALRKAEQEHQAGKQSTWLDQSIPEHINRKKSPGFWLLGTLIVINFAALSFFIWLNSSDAQNSPDIVKETAEIFVEKGSEDDEFSKVEADATNFIGEKAETPSIQLVSKKNTRKSFAETVTAREVAKEKEIQISQEQKHLISDDQLADKSGVVQKKQSISSLDTKPEPLTEDDSKLESLVLEDKKSTGEENRDQAYIPSLKELPLDFRRSVPDININVYVYSEDDGERFVVVDMVKYTSGDMIVDNMELKEIRSDSLVVEYKGETFRITRP